MMWLSQDRPIIICLGIAAFGLICLALGAAFHAQGVLAAWHVASSFVIGLPLGAMTIVMIHGLTGGRWGSALHVPLRALVATLPLAVLMLLPSVLRPDLVFPWAGDLNVLSEVVKAKLSYLNVPFFRLRFVLYAFAWLVMAGFLLAQTAPGNRVPSGKFFAIGLLVQGLSVSVFAIDWMLSLDPEFASTIYGMIEAAAEVVGAGAIALLALALSASPALRHRAEEKSSAGEDIANMLFGFMLVWAYLSYMQWLVVWAGDLPDDIHWYITRSQGSWLGLLGLVIVFQFLAPFIGFMDRRIKRGRWGLAGLSLCVFAGHMFEVIWRLHVPQPTSFWLSLAALLTAVALFAAAFLWFFKTPERVLVWRRIMAHG